MRRPAFPQTRDRIPPESVLRQLRIPFVRKVTLVRGPAAEEVFVIDLGLAGVFVERPEPLPVGEQLDIRLSLPGSEIPLHARCPAAWWHPEGARLASQSLPPGAS